MKHRGKHVRGDGENEAREEGGFLCDCGKREEEKRREQNRMEGTQP